MADELIANMLGLRVEGVTDAAGRLQRFGLITYQRGRITVLNRPALEKLSCECYVVVKQETDRLLPAAYRGKLATPTSRLVDFGNIRFVQRWGVLRADLARRDRDRIFSITAAPSMRSDPPARRPHRSRYTVLNSTVA